MSFWWWWLHIGLGGLDPMVMFSIKIPTIKVIHKFQEPLCQNAVPARADTANRTRMLQLQAYQKTAPSSKKSRWRSASIPISCSILTFRAWTVQEGSAKKVRTVPGILTAMAICGMQETKIKFKSCQDRPKCCPFLAVLQEFLAWTTRVRLKAGACMGSS